MEKVKEWVKAHPKLTAALVVGVVVLVYLMRRSAAASAAAATPAGGLSSSDYVNLQNAELQAATQLQAQQTAETLRQTQIQDQYQATLASQQNQLAIAQLQQQAVLAQIYAQTGVQTTTVAAQKDVALATIDANTRQSANQTSIDLALINILAGKQQTVNPLPSSMPQPVVTSSMPQIVSRILTGPVYSPTGAAEGTTAAFASQSIPAYVLPGPVPSGAAAAGISQIPGVNYNFPNQPYQQDYVYPSESAAINAGALIKNSIGQYVPAIPGEQITY